MSFSDSFTEALAVPFSGNWDCFDLMEQLFRFSFNLAEPRISDSNHLCGERLVSGKNGDWNIWFVLKQTYLCVDNSGKPQFADRLSHRGNPCFFVLDFCLRAKIRA